MKDLCKAVYFEKGVPTECGGEIEPISFSKVLSESCLAPNDMVGGFLLDDPSPFPPPVLPELPKFRVCRKCNAVFYR